MQKMLNNIKREFEIIPSIQVYEEYSNGEKIYNTTLRFYTNEKYKEICDLAELFYIASILSDKDNPQPQRLSQHLLNNIIHIEGAEPQKLKIEELFELNKINLSLLIGSRATYYKNNGKKIFFQDRISWEIEKWKRRYYYRRRLALYIAPNNINHISIEKEILCLI